MPLYIFHLLLTVCTVVKSKEKISQDFVAFSEYVNFNFVTKHLVWMHHSCFKSLQRFMSKFKVAFRLLQNMLLNAFNTKLRENSLKNCHTKLTVLFHSTMLNALPKCKCSGHLAHYEQRTSSKCCTQMFTVKLRVHSLQRR